MFRRSPFVPLLLACAFSVLPPAAANAPAAQIEGKVTLGRNRPLVGAVVLVRSETDPGPIWVTASDQNGAFRVRDLPDGTYRIGIRRDGLRPFEQTGVVLKAPFRGIVEAILAPADPVTNSEPEPDTVPAAGTIRIVGTVTGADGDPAAGAEVRFVRSDGSVDPHETRVGATGDVEVADLPAGRWRVEVLDPGAIPLRATVDVTQDVVLRVRLVAQPANFQVAIEDLMPKERAIAPPGFARGR
jgi:hypothetical protein